MTTRVFLHHSTLTPQSVGSTYTLTSEDSHHLARVLRLGIGATLEVADPSSGVVALATVRSISDLVHVTIDSIVSTSTTPTTRSILLMALCKGQKNDQVCDWATELGATEIIFWQASRSVVRIKDSTEAAHKEARLQKIALAAAQQSKRVRPPRVRVVTTLSEALAAIEVEPMKAPLRIICSLAADARPMRDSLESATSNTDFVMAIGPEGDFTNEESELLLSSGFIKISLGAQTLRSELAAVTALARWNLR